ncbi:MAG: aminotransferase class I/II-fold pyridoxal phosphate-dependent enzyme [Deltaproteobacteria bacterium]|jgi:aspartate/methionine/tyrosine aminotransferase|nr:aminotransferase class I/II-fold pyridoxal phosphate-dependent enzyme [Deltaproteobacteria bacterium]
MKNKEKAAVNEQVKNNIISLLRSYEHPEPEKWAELISQKEPQIRLGIIQKLVPDAFISKDAKLIHEQISNHYPELNCMLKGTASYYTCFPKSGIPAQAFAIARHVDPGFNAGIGIAKTYSGDIMLNPEFRKIFDRLQPEGSDDEKWRQVRNSVFKYNNGLGASWYREIAAQRYLRDAISEPMLLEAMRKALRIKPIPTYGGTVGLSIAFEMGVGEETILVLPSTYWGNIDLKTSHHKTIKEKCNYIDREGRIKPHKLEEKLLDIKGRGHRKVAIYFNFPHNPTGMEPTRIEAQAFSEIVREVADPDFKVVIICDEPYYPFVRGKDSIKVPFSYYMQPGYNRNILTFVSINGTKRDGMYGMRHSDLAVLVPEDVSREGVRIFEERILAGYMRGTFSFSHALSQYLLARAITGDPLISIRKNKHIRLSTEFFKQENKLIDYVETSVNDTIDALSNLNGLERIVGSKDNDAYGGFFVTYRLSEELKDKGVKAIDIHKAGLKTNCGVIATNDFIRVSALVNKKNDPQFAKNLQLTIERAIKMKKQESFNEMMF